MWPLARNRIVIINIITREPTANPDTRFKLTWGFYDKPAYDNWIWTDNFFLDRLIDQGEFDPFHSLSFEGVDITHSQRFGSTG